MIHPNVPQCHYIKTDGRRCGSPALRQRRFCYFHYEVNRPTVELGIPPLEDADSIQLALTDLARAVAQDRFDQKRAGILAYILQIAAFNLKRVHLGIHKDDMVRQLPEENPYTRNGARRDPWKLGEGGETVDAPPSPADHETGIEAETADSATEEPSRRQPQSIASRKPRLKSAT
ncbi:MAG: hypothetical protein ACRD2Q_10420 [Terriglobales bacterium]